MYLSDITDLVEVDIESGKIINRFNAPDSFLMTSFQMIKGISMYRIQLQILSISKMRTLKMSNNTSLQVWLQSPQLEGPNGLHVDNTKNRLIIASLGVYE